MVYTFSVWAFSISYMRNKYQIIDQVAGFGGHPHLGHLDENGEELETKPYESNLFLFFLFNLDYGFREGPAAGWTAPPALPDGAAPVLPPAWSADLSPTAAPPAPRHPAGAHSLSSLAPPADHQAPSSRTPSPRT